MTELQQSILKTLIYFDIHDYPLTVMEVWKWLYRDYADKTQIGTDGSWINHGSITDIQKIINQMSDKVESKDGFYFLKGRGELIKIRLDRYNLTEQKFKRARKFVKILWLIPFVRCVMVVNRLAYSNVHQNSDIDLAVVVQKNRLWLTRLLSIGLFNLLKVRPKQINRAKAIDLSFFISEDSLNLESLKNDEDVLFPFWVSQFVPVYDDGIFDKLVKSNQWIKDYLPNSFKYQLNDRRQVRRVSRANWLISLLVNWDFLEKMSKKYQMKILPQDLKEMMNQDSRVVINDKFLKFHRHDSRVEVQEKFDKVFDYLNI